MRFPRGGRQQGGEHLDRGGLAGAVGAEQAENLTGVDRKGEPVHRRKCAEAPGEGYDVQNDFAHGKGLAQASSTTILPTFCPWKRPMKAAGAWSIPFTTVSLFFNLPVLI